MALDIDFFYVAYKKGDFDRMLHQLAERFDLPLEEELTKAELRAVIGDYIGFGEFYTMTGRASAFKSVDGDVPIGLLGADRDRHILWPHIEWFSWASPRNKIECALKFLTDMRVDNIIYVFARPEDHGFWMRMAQYGVFRRIGKSEDHWTDGAESVIWRSQGYRRERHDARNNR
tara:strand:+ start:211 stop:732 length:522 start_codon:yes stop_codon:yes gene_type:complete